MPIYEYRCPDGHTFELFQRMTDPPIEQCRICGLEPVEKVLYPAAIHFKGKGFYSTDYGRSGRKRDPGKESEGGGSAEKGESKGESKGGESKTEIKIDTSGGSTAKASDG